MIVKLNLLQHSELTNSFKKYLMKQGLEELDIANYSIYGVLSLLGMLVSTLLLTLDLIL